MYVSRNRASQKQQVLHWNFPNIMTQLRIIPRAVLSPAANLEASTPLRRRSSKEKMDPMTTGDFGANGPADEEPQKLLNGWRFQGR